MKKICKKCGKELLEDSNFCQYCGSDEIETIDEKPKAFKKCAKCGSNLPIDSEFCQYCGSKNIDVINDNVINNVAKNNANTINGNNTNSYRTKFIVVLIIAICAICCAAYFYSMYTETNNNLSTYISENKSLEYQLSSANSKLSIYKAYKTKADNYDDLLKYANYSKGYSDYYARQTLLYKPKQTKVWVYFGHYNTNVYFQTSSSSVFAEWGDWSGNWIPLTVTYRGSGIEYIKLSSDANNEIFYITIVG